MVVKSNALEILFYSYFLKGGLCYINYSHSTCSQRLWYRWSTQTYNCLIDVGPTSRRHAYVENGVSPIPDLPSELCTAVPVTPIEVRPSLYLFSAWQVRGPLFSQRWYLHLLRNAINVQVGNTTLKYTFSHTGKFRFKCNWSQVLRHPVRLCTHHHQNTLVSCDVHLCFCQPSIC